jgi:hypothetical protein
MEMDFTSRASRIGDIRRSEMDLGVCDSIQVMDLRSSGSALVNVAAFTGARFRRSESVLCDVVEIDTERLLVRTRFPQRVFAMWVSKEWIDQADCLN